MTFAPFWLGGLALAAVAIAHFLVTGQHLAVSGRIGALIDHLRSARRSGAASEPTEEELIAAVRAMTLEEFGSDAVDEAPSVVPTRPKAGVGQDALFLAGLALGGLVTSLVVGGSVVGGLAGDGFAAAFGSGDAGFVALFAGGLLVGFGTRMAGGCTSGHGLIGVPSLKVGSMVATACFFGAGIVASFLIEALR